MIRREITDIVLEYAKKFPVVTITGPRQSGKTTLSKALFPHKPYVSLEELDNRNYAQSDPRGFLSKFPDCGTRSPVLGTNYKFMQFLGLRGVFKLF